MIKINKKANIDDIPEAFIIVFMFVFTLFMTYLVLSSFNTFFDTSTTFNTSEKAMTFYDTYRERFLNGWDWGLLFLMVLMPIFSFVAARKIPVDTVYIIIFVFVIVFYVLMAMIGANIHGALLDNATYSAFVNQTTYIKFIMPNMLYYVLAYIFIVVLGLYTKEA
jgi:hypothetical protein